MTIALISCWYGTFPWYLPYFLHTCNSNRTIDFFIITDKSAPSNVIFPKNVKIINLSLSELNSKISNKLNFCVKIKDPYKLCDFKPAYGLLFSEYLENYDFWGHCDLDIVFGNIRAFMTNQLLNSYDVISARHDYITGSFALWRNNSSINNLFMKSKDYKKVFQSDKNFCFDECAYLFKELQNGASIYEFPDSIQSMTFIVLDEVRNSRLRAHFDFIIIEGTPGDITWENGKLVYRNEFEAMYYHLIKFKEQGLYPKITFQEFTKMNFTENELTIS